MKVRLHRIAVIFLEYWERGYCTNYLIFPNDVAALESVIFLQEKEIISIQITP